MSDRVEVVSLGVGWVRHLKAQAREAWRDFPVWIGLGTAITVGAVLICPRTPTGIGVLTFAMVLVLGALSWMSRPDRAVRLPVSKLMLLGFVTCLPQLPLMIMAADKEGVVVSSILLIVSVVLSTVASPLAAMGFMVAVPILLCGGFLLGACYAPHLVTAHGLDVRQALHGSLLAWIRNPMMFLLFLVLGLLFVASRIVVTWILLIVLFPVPTVATVLALMVWAACGLLYAAALVGFGRAAFEAACGESVG